jgi:hypothetical protein
MFGQVPRRSVVASGITPGAGGASRRGERVELGIESCEEGVRGLPVAGAGRGDQG